MNQNIYILTENEFLNDLLRKNRFSGKKNCFLDLNLNSSKINNVKDFKKLDRFFAYKNSNVFIKNYIDLFSKLSVKNHSRIWWCSEHVTRNRFTSDLPNILANYIEIVRATKKSSFDNFVFVVQDKQLGNTLKRLLINKDNFGLKIE